MVLTQAIFSSLKGKILSWSLSWPGPLVMVIVSVMVMALPPLWSWHRQCYPFLHRHNIVIIVLRKIFFNIILKYWIFWGAGESWLFVLACQGRHSSLSFEKQKEKNWWNIFGRMLKHLFRDQKNHRKDLRHKNPLKYIWYEWRPNHILPKTTSGTLSDSPEWSCRCSDMPP